MASFAMSIIGIVLIGVILALIVSIVGFDNVSPYVGGTVIIIGGASSLIQFLKAILPRQKSPIR